MIAQMSNKEFLQHLTNAKRTNELIIDSPDEFKQNQDIFWTEVSKLQNLKRLRLENQNVGAIPLEVRALNKLEEISIIDEFLADGKGLKSIPKVIFSLPNIRKIEIVGQRIQKIPAKIKQLKTLEIFIVGNTIWEDLYGEVEEIVGKTKIHELPLELFELINLNLISVNGVELLNIPQQIGLLENLKSFSARANNINSLPKEMMKLKNLESLDLQDNPLMLPFEIIANVNLPKAILESYFASRRPLNQAKSIFIGEGDVGKTSLIEQILHGTFDPNQAKTTGISINQWTVDNRLQTVEAEPPSMVNGQSSIKVNIWDFGGQEIMHATHKFFLTKRSLYLLVLDARQTQEQNRVEYWLKIIQSSSDESPVLIIGNKTDEHPLDIDRAGLQKKYPNVVGIIETSAATGAGIEELKTAIAEQVNNLPHVRDLLPETWFTVKTKLEGLGRESNFITYDKYLELCAENEVNDETSQRTLIGFLHDLGVILYFQDDYRLSELGILNPQWVTNGVYKIINSHALFQNKGVLTSSMLDEILNLPEYSRGKRLSIVDMMKKFELCYDIEADKTFLVPDLLPKDEPAELKFNGVPAFEYAYPVLPSSVITRFIVRMNQHIDDNCVWRTGVVLKIGDNTALVKADIEDRKVTIAIDGLEHTRRDALSAIRYQLDEIHGSIKGLNPEKYVPVPGAINAKPLKYEYLLKLERAGQETLLAEDGNELKEINISQVLNGVENEYQRKQIGGNVTNNFNINIGKNAKVGDIILASTIQKSFNKADAADIRPELKETLKQLAEAVDMMNKSLPEEKAAEVAEDLGKLVDEATKSKPNKKWYSVSVEGLIKAAENLDKLGEPVINLSRKVLLLLTGGVIK